MLAVWVPGAYAESPADTLSRAIESYRAYDYAAAEEHFERALDQASKLRPKDKRLSAALGGLADARFVLGKDEEAETLYRRQLESLLAQGDAAAPPANAALWALALVCTAQGKNGDASVALKQLAPEPKALVRSTVLVADARDVRKLTLLNDVPLAYSEAAARRMLRQHEHHYGRAAAAAPLKRLLAVLRELGREVEVREIETRLAGNRRGDGGIRAAAH